jgi:hypothetical protein
MVHDEIAELRWRNHGRHRFFRQDERSLDVLRTYFKTVVKTAESQTGLEVVRDRGELVGYLAYWHDPDAWYGTPTTIGLIDLAPNRVDLVAWAIDDFRKRSPDLGPTLDMSLDAHDGALIAGLVGEGMRPDAAVLVGCPQRSLELLVRHKNPPPGLEHLDLSVSSMDTESKVHAAMDLKKRVFEDERSRCWFYEHVSEQERSAVLTQLGSGELENRFHVIENDETVVGMFGYSLEEENPYWGNTAGMDLVLDRSIQGRGVVKTCYLHMLKSMVDERVDVFKGGTNQPAVMGLSRLMDRSTYTYVLRRNTPFGWSDFSLLDPG